MARTIEISDATYGRLKALMRSSDTTEAVISKLLDVSEKTNQPSIKSSSPIAEVRVSKIRAKRTADLEFVNQAVPDLTHAKLLLAYVDGMEVKPVKWNQLLISAITKAVQKDGKASVGRMSGISLDKRNDSGFKFYSDLQLSVQGQDANDAWRLTEEIAKKHGWLVESLCEWRAKEGAAYPGQSAILVTG